MEKIREDIVEKVRECLQNWKPGGVSLEVVEDEIHRVDSWWRIPVRPSAWPAKRYEYYEALAEIEGELQEKAHLNVLLATSDPVEVQPS